MTDNLQPLYDILGEAFKAGAAHAKDETLSAADSLFPLAARMEKEVKKLIEEEREANAMIAQTLMPLKMDTWYQESAGLMGFNIACTDVMIAIRARSLPSSPERET